MESLRGQFLVAMPEMGDDRFRETVIYLVGHGEEGAMGLVINQSLEDMKFADILEELQLGEKDELIQLPDAVRNRKVLRGGPVQRWLPKGLAGKPIFVFETGGTTGIPKSRIGCEDFRIDYEYFSETLPDEHFPKGSNWLMLGPSGPRRLRLSVEHLAQYRGGICFCLDLDPRWVIKLIKMGDI